MATVLIVIHLMIVLAMIGLVLLQRSEGGALGIGGGGGGRLLTRRSAGDLLTRSTGILAAAFFATSILLTIAARFEANPTDVLDRLPAGTPATQAPAPVAPPTSGPGVLDALRRQSGEAPAAPAAPAAPGPVAPSAPAAPAPAQ